MFRCQKKFSNGSICNGNLAAGFKYCPTCGTRVPESRQGSDKFEEESIPYEADKSVPETLKTEMKKQEDPGGGKDSETLSKANIDCTTQTVKKASKSFTEKKDMQDGMVNTENVTTKEEITADISQNMRDDSKTEKDPKKELKVVLYIDKNGNESMQEIRQHTETEKKDQNERPKGQNLIKESELMTDIGQKKSTEQSEPLDIPIQDSDFECSKDEEKVKESQETRERGNRGSTIEEESAATNILNSMSSGKGAEDDEKGKITEKKDGENNRDGKQRNTLSGGTSDLSNQEKVKADKVNKSITGKEGNENLTGKEGKENITGKEGKENIIGKEGNENLTGKEGKENITGKEGKEKITGKEGKENGQVPKQPENTEKPVKTEKESENQQRRCGGSQSTGQNEKCQPEMAKKKVVKVIFHAFLAPNVTMNLQKDKIFVVFGPPCGDWETKKGEVLKTTEFQVKNHPIRLKATAMIEKDLLKEPLRYAYKLQHQEKNVQEIVTESEFYLNSYEPYKRKYRLLDIPLDAVGEWNQYDGCIYAAKRGILFSIREMVTGNFQDVMLNDGKYILHRYLQNVTECLKAGKQLNELQNIFRSVNHGGIKDQFLKNPKTPDVSLFKQELWDHLKIVTEVLEDTKGKDMGLALLTSIMIIDLIKDLDIPFEIIDDLHVKSLQKCLVLRPDTDHQACEQLEYLEKHLPNDSRQKAKSSIVTFLKRTMFLRSHVDPTWLACMPLVHFLEGNLQPFVPLDLRQFEITETKHDEWWCFSEFDKEKNEMKRNRWTISCEEFVKMHRPLFQLDSTLQKTFMSALDIAQVPEVIPISQIQLEIKLATIEHYFENSSEVHTRDLQEGMNKVYAILVKKLTCLPKDTPQRTWSEIDVKHKIHNNQLTAILNHVLQRLRNDWKLVLTCFHCSLLSLAILDKITAVCEDLESLPILIATLLNEFCGSRDVDLQMGDYALSIRAHFPFDHLPGNFERTILSAVEKYLNLCNTQEVVDMYVSGMLGIQSHVLQSLVERKTFSSLEEIAKDRNLCGILQYPEDILRNNFYISNLLSQFFQRVWTLELNASPTAYLEQILTCNCYPQYVESYYQKGLLLNYMDGESVRKLERSLDILQDFITAIENNSIMIQDLLVGLKHLENLRNIAEKLETIPDFDLPLTPDSLSILLECRGKDIKTLNDEIKIVEGLKMILKWLRNYKSGLPNGYETVLQNWKKMKLEDICVIPKQMSDFAMYTPRLKVFTEILEEPVKSFVKCISFYKQSKTFQTVIKSVSKQQSGEMKNYDFFELFEEVLNPAKDMWEEYCTSLENGTITIRDIETLQLHKVDDSSLQKEFTAMNRGSKKPWIKNRIDEFRRYKCFSRSVETAGLLKEIQSTNNIEGNFDSVELIERSDRDKAISLKEMASKIQSFNQKLEKVDEKKRECLKSFCRSHALVKWLRNSLKGGVKDLKIYADLAFMSVEEDDLIAHITDLHTAAIGYAPLIFYTENIQGEDALIQRCEEVWTSLEKDEDLPRKLIESNRLLQWFVEIKEAHGSVEVTSLKQVDAIKQRGIFRVGTREGKHDIHLSLQDVVCLCVPRAVQTDHFQETLVKDLASTCEESPEDLEETVCFQSKDMETKRADPITEGREYSYSDMMDLQSRLMLVSGKTDAGRENIEKFTAIFDNITRLGRIFIKLYSSGCVLFKQWSFEFLCNKSVENCAFVKFGQQQESTLKGTNTKSRDEHLSQDDVVNDYMQKIADFLEDCYEQWMGHVRETRDRFYPLNFFTVAQMIILQEELAMYRHGSHDSKHLLALLSYVKSDCSLEDLEFAFKSLDEQLTKQQDKDVIGESSASQENRAIQDFLKAAVDAGMSKRRAMQCIQSNAFDPQDIESSLIWCYEEDEKEEENIVDTVNDISNPEFSRDPNTVSLKDFDRQIENLLRQEAVESIEKRLSEIWRKYLKFTSLSMNDFLSVEHLGFILQHIYDTNTKVCSRPLPAPLKPGKPNLIVCSQGEVLPMLLTLLMNDQTLPLPGRNEVLLCTELTTTEEVIMFFRRALRQEEHDKNRPIFCLVNADLIRYDVCEESLREFKEEMRAARTEYSLVVICSSENEYQSPIIAALDKFRTPKMTVSAEEKIQHYLRNKFCTRGKVESNAASIVDESGLCVRVVKSNRAGLGKTLHKNRLVEQLRIHYPSADEEEFPLTYSIPLSQKDHDFTEVSRKFMDYTLSPDIIYPRIFHIDVASGIDEGVASLLFNLIILGSVVDDRGYAFQRSMTDLYLIEITVSDKSHYSRRSVSGIRLIDLLPCVRCLSPQEELKGMMREMENGDMVLGFDNQMFQSEVFQRPFQYLQSLESNKKIIPIFNRFSRIGNKRECLQTLLRHCCVEDPSWSELRNFVHFLNTQLGDFEKSVFCGTEMAADLPGFAKFVLRFLIQMSKDFSTRSLMMTDDDEKIEPKIYQGEVENENEETNDEEDIIDLSQFQIRRRWESSAHPYLFFNPDHHTMTFLGFNISKMNRNLVDNQTGQILERNIMTPHLWDALIGNRVPLQENFEDLNRYEKLERLCRVIGNEFPHDPDETYELTTDNVKKMMAIYMRFRCNIPVIVMGETGCGKTRLIKFLCALQCPPGAEIKTMAVMKVHGGTTKKHIVEKVKKAEETAKENCESNGSHIFTVLFFDEANTTEAIGSIKEIMCDGTIDGRPINLNENLKLVAACNPYRKHPEEMIARLEKAGLGYHVNVEETTDRLGRIPMRHLVYRVQPLPQSMIPLVWDFGQLDSTVERLYIIQMLNRYMQNGTIPRTNAGSKIILADILTASQDYMRDLQDECSFVSLRDVERTLKVFGWFYNQTNLFEEMDQIIDNFSDSDTESSEDEEVFPTFVNRGLKTRDDARIIRSVILALGVCYHASLKNREEYRNYIAGYFRHPLNLQRGGRQIEREIKKCQRIFLEKVNLNENIAKNMALRENFFMMVVCVELGIPLFLVGKPGSSKSLSKSILDQNMQGRESHSDLFKNFKQVQIISFQCSPLATAEGILKTFQQASKLQENKDLRRFASVVVLDEVGLAEDSPRMPLKALHPLLEDGCPDDEEYQEHKKVAFIGISNWALDPAKMNRGILVQREVPDEEELIASARGICSTNEEVRELLEGIIPKLAKGYLQVFQKTITTGVLFGTTSRDHLKAREFFGLRDFYSLVKMMFAIASRSMEIPTPKDIAYVIRRNLGGLQGLDPVAEFSECVDELQEFQNEDDGFAADVALVRKCLEHGNEDSESRYVLLLTENYSALTLLQQLLTNNENTQILFGSSFPKDQEYIEICRNINRIKVFMETGKTVVLLNLENLYESLYDALNQYYMESGSERFIDLGLGTHRVKCKVDRNFRLIVVAEKRVVYKEFPIPLINRLEKHFLTMEGLLTNAQLRLSKELSLWVEEFSACSRQSIGPEEVFIGYNQDTCPGIILQSWDLCAKKHANEDDDFMEEVLQTAKYFLLWSCTPDALFRLQLSSLSMFREEYIHVYFDQQCHDSLCSFLHHRIDEETFKGHFIQVTTHSKLLSMEDKQDIENNIPMLKGKIALLSLQAFGTEQQFSRQIREIAHEQFELLIIQCDTGDENSNLVSCARHCVQREMNSSRETCIIFLVHLSRVCKVYFTGFQTGLWSSVHIDDLRLSTLPSAQKLLGMTLSELLNESLKIHSDGGKKEYKVDMRKLFLDCLHPALASISDMSESGETSIDRVKTVFALLEKEQDLTQGQFGYGVMQHLVKILSFEEEDVSMYDHSTLIQRAATIGNITKCGTLRSSCSKSIEGKVVPLLAKIICFMDTNNNLQILDNACECSWMYIVWMRLLFAVDAKILNKQRELVTQSTGKNIGFKSIFPFSWLLFENVEKILQSCSESKIGNSPEELFIQSPMALIINEVIRGKDTLHAMQLYISDFVNMKCKTFSNREKQLICESLIANMEQRSKGIPELLSDCLVCIHSVFRGMEYSVKTFCDIASLNEHLQDEKFFENVNNSYQMLDIGSVKYLLEKLNPIDAIETHEGQIIWMQQFQIYKPFIERILHQTTENLQTGNPRRRFIEQMRSTWTKITALKLYIENIAGDERKDKLINQDCKFLWKFLGENANFKTIETLEKFEKFLKASNKKAMKDFLDKFGKCHHCKIPLNLSPPIILPCGHKICRENCQYMIITEEDVKKCPECLMEIENDAEYDMNDEESEEMKPFWDYQKKSNRFYMQIVSQLCFENSSAPSEEVCKRLLQLVVFKKKLPELNMTIIRTRDIGVFETIVDTTPVFRSFLLQLLIRSNENTVLQLFMKETVEILDEDIHGSHMKDICLMLIQCIEDSLMEESLSHSFQSEMEREICFAKESMLLAKEQLQAEGTTVDKIKSIARARFGLQVTAKYLYGRLNTTWEFTESELAMCTDLFQTSASLCDSPLEHIRMYLLKHVCRRYGLEFYRNIQSSAESWVLPSEDGDNTEKQSADQHCPDYCLVLGEQYRKIKEKISEILVPTDMSRKLKLKDKSRTVQVFFLLGLCKELKSRSLFQEENIQTKEQLKCKVQKLLKNQKLQIVMDYLEELFDDSVGRSCDQLNLRLCDNMHDESIIFLIFHLMFVLKVTGNKGPLQPLQALAFEPNILEGAFLPTMPEECLSKEIQEELQRMEKIANKAHHNFTWYRCPNGHLYGVGDCGNPTQKGHCFECHAEIGSESEINRKDNVRYTGDDQSRRGHILGSPTNRTFDAVSERNLSPISNAVLRLLTHLSMFIGANYNIEEITKCIHPTVDEDDVPGFLWDHILVDISTLRKTLDQGLDGVFMLLHVLVHSFLKEEPTLAVAIRNDQDIPLHILKTKDGRKPWEMEFSLTYIAEIMQRSKELFKTCEDILSEDTSIVSDPVLRKVFDLDEASCEQFTFNEMQTCDFIWQHRIKVSFEHFVHEFHMLRDRIGPEVERFALLDAFLRQDCYLRYLRYIPAVVRMQSALKANYRKQITREEARSLTIRDCLQQCRQGPFSKEIEDGVVSICELWKCFRKFYFDFETLDMNKDIEALLERNIDVDVDSVSLLIPDTRGSGTIISLLFRFMIWKQNAFVKLFEDITQTRTSNVKDISFDDLAESDLISYHHKADLLPIIISNCNYTYAKDERTTLDYDFDSIQSAIKDQILQGKPILNVSEWKWPWNTVFRADADVTRFATLSARINQKPLDSMLQRQIIADFADLPDIYEAIENIDTVVNFLLSVSCSGDDLLSEFMEDILQMSSLLSQKASVSCRLHHVQSLWFLFMFEKTKRLTSSEKDGFESIHENIKEPLTEQMCKDLSWYLTDLSTEKLGVILEQLLECILFTLNQGQWNYSSYLHSLSDTLMVHLEDPLYSEVDLKTLGLNDVQRLPSTILSSHSVEVWKMINCTIQSRK